MMSILFVALLLPCILSTAHYDQLEERIVNGIPISANQYPWMVSLRGHIDILGDKQFCGGSLIGLSPPIILTAAHCLDIFTYDSTDETTRATINNQLSPPVHLYADINRTYDVLNISNDTYYTIPFNVLDIHIHPLYTRTFYGYDIALIIVNDFNESQSEIDINYYQTLLPQLLTSNVYDDNTQCCAENEELTVIGYGKIEHDGEDSMVLRTTNMKYVDRIDCIDAYVQSFIKSQYDGSYPTNETLKAMGVTWEEFQIQIAGYYTQVETESAIGDDTGVCIIGNNTDVCQGDSGGPLFRMNQGEVEIIGIASFVIQGCNDGNPSVYTNIATYHDGWMKQTIYEASTAAFEEGNIDGVMNRYGFDLIHIVIIGLAVTCLCQ